MLLLISVLLTVMRMVTPLSSLIVFVAKVVEMLTLLKILSRKNSKTKSLRMLKMMANITAMMTMMFHLPIQLLMRKALNQITLSKLRVFPTVLRRSLDSSS